MTYKEIARMVEAMGLPYSYYQFNEGTAVPPPFIVYFFSGTDDVYADDENYQRIVPLSIELYTDTKRIDLEYQVEAVLKMHGLTYAREEEYIDSEKMLEQVYTMEVLINE